MAKNRKIIKTQKLALNLLVRASDAERVAVAQNIKTQLDSQRNLYKYSTSC